jgi:signal transduction histidine kinase/CheY-like chemotaxis protein
MLMAEANSRFRKIAQAGSVFLIVLGIAVLVGWAADISFLKTVLLGRISMKANTAIGFLCSGLALWLLLRDRLSRLLRYTCVVLSLLVFSIGTGTLIEYLFHIDLKIDQLIFIDHQQFPYPGRLAHITAINFCAAGIGFLLLCWRERVGKAAQLPAIFIGFSAMLAIIGYLYAVPLLYGSLDYTSMALHTGVAFLVLACTTMICAPDNSLLALLSSSRPAGWLSRTLLPVAIALPFLLGLGAIHSFKLSENARLVVTILVFAQIVLFTGLIWISFSRLDASEEEEELTRESLVTSKQMLLQSQKMEAIGVLAGGLAHDFNNLLNVIVGYSELLLNDASLVQLHRSRVEKIVKAGQTATALTRQLLAFSRQQVLQPKALDLNQIISGTDGYLHRLITENIELSTSLDAGLMATIIDPTQLEQILLNLVVNACDAMPRGGKLHLETGNVVLEDPMASNAGVKSGPFVRLKIVDTGIGMDDNTRRHIFEPFFTTKPVGKGTGLGLATVYGIVKQSGGFIEVDSKVGRGTTFIVYLPGSRISTSQEPQRAIASDTGEGTTILVVEDSEPLRELILETLESLGYTTLMAKDGQQAIRLANQFSEKIDLLLTDVIMPKMNGPEVMKRVKQIRPDVGVLFMSGYTNDVTLRHGVSNADVSFIQKPFSSAELMDKIREALVEAKERTAIRRRLSIAMAKPENPLSAKDPQ